MTINKVCVIGSGTMGAGIAQVSAQAGYETTMVDIKQEYLDRGMNQIKASLGKFAEKGKIKQEEINEVLARLRTSVNMKDAAKDADYVIEAVFERADVKLTIFEQLEEICPEETILASNTSGIPISLLASATRRPDRVIGAHFMNPVPLMKGVEVVIVANRIYMLTVNEAVKLLEEGAGRIEDMDKLMRLSFNWPMGPFELADLIGIDVIVDLLEGIYQETGWERYKPTPLLKRMVEMGYTGRKAGKGFYQLFAQS